MLYLFAVHHNVIVSDRHHRGDWHVGCLGSGQHVWIYGHLHHSVWDCAAGLCRGPRLLELCNNEERYLSWHNDAV